MPPESSTRRTMSAREFLLVLSGAGVATILFAVWWYAVYVASGVLGGTATLIVVVFVLLGATFLALGIGLWWRHPPGWFVERPK